MDMQAIFFPQGNDVIVEARYGPEITDNTGMNSELFWKFSRQTPDDDPSTAIYSAPVISNPDVPGQFMSRFTVPDTDTGVTGSFWYRVDVIDVADNRRTAGCGTLLVEAVLWSQEEK